MADVDEKDWIKEHEPWRIKPTKEELEQIKESEKNIKNKKIKEFKHIQLNKKGGK